MIEVKVPDLPESIEEATLMAWHKQAGQAVARDEKLADIETDKVVLEVSAEQAGVLQELVAKEGATLRRGDIIARIDTEQVAEPDAAPAPAPAPSNAPVAEPAASPAASTPTPQPQTPPSTTSTTADELDDLSPAVRKLVAEHNLEPETIKGTGRGGRITKADVLRYIDGSPTVTVKIGEIVERPPVKKLITPTTGERGERRVPMTRIRARIAERLVQAQQTAAMLTTFNEVNMQPVMDLRTRLKEEFEKDYGIKLGFMSFFVKAVIEALKKFPAINASIDGTDILYHEYFDIGIAVSSPRGLVVPILRDADSLSFAEVEGGIREFGARAQEAKLTIEELQGGTFTLSNGGVFGSLLSTPILNPPQTGILGMHKIQERPVAEDGQVVIRPMMYLALTYDHRIVDGREAVQFLVSLRESLEDPARMLLQV